MGRKKKKDIEFEEKKRLISQIANSVIASEEERLFAVLIVSGYSAAAAYRISHPESKASVVSSAVLGSRFIKESGVQRALEQILKMYWGGWLYLRETGYQGKIKGRSYYYDPKKKYRLNPYD